ncbi:MAG: MarC family protein, partial [Bacteroidota bacterium]
AGSLIIFFLGLEMILGVKLFQEDNDDDNTGAKSGTIVPLAFPLIAGAGTMTTILSLKAKYQEADILVAILLNILIVYIVLRSSEWIGKKLGTSGTNVLRKVFGIILLAIAVKLFKDNFFVFAAN